jgi:hypothetical protein
MAVDNRPFKWDRASGRYRYPNGRVVPRAQVRAWLDEALDTATKRIDALATALRTGGIDLVSWQVRMQREVKNVALYSAATARGGWAQLTDADLGRVGRYLQNQYRFLNRFTLQIQRGEQALDGRLNARAQLYAQAGRPLYELMDRAEQRVRGMTGRRNIRHAGDSCDGCLEATAAGWVGIDSTEVEEIGARECSTRCKCTWEYR